MSKDRQRRRAEREAERQRAVEQAREANAAQLRRRQRIDRLQGSLLRRRPKTSLQRARSRRARAAFLCYLLVQLFVWQLTDSWTVRIALALLSLFALPAFTHLIADRSR